MSDALATAAASSTTSTTVRRKPRHAFGVASLALGSVTWLAYGSLIVTVALIVAFVPGWLVLLLQLTQATGLPFIILTGGPWGFMFGVMALFGVVGMVAFVVYLCASALSVLGVIYGVIGLVQREKRPYAVTGLLLSTIIVVVSVILLLLVNNLFGVSAG